MDKKLEHLKMIEDVIARLAKNSFDSKLMCITLVTAIISFVKTGKIDLPVSNILVLSVGIVLLFEVIGMSYSGLEYAYRRLYGSVSKKIIAEGDDYDYSMKYTCSVWERWKHAATSFINVIFFNGLLIAVILFITLPKDLCLLWSISIPVIHISIMMGANLNNEKRIQN